MTKKKIEETPQNNIPTEYQHEGLRSIYLELDNFKNIDKKIVDIGGRSMIFMGKNQTGKSTLIQAMVASMNSKLLPSEPIKKGEERAMIKHVIGGNINGQPKTYVTDIYFTPKDKKGRLVVTNEKGETLPSPASLMKSIIGNVSLDPMEWLSDSKDKKLKKLKVLTGCAEKIDIVTMEIDRLKDIRKNKAVRAEELEATLNNHPYTTEQRELYSNEKPLAPIQEQLSQVAEVQKVWDGVKSQHDQFHANISNITATNERSANEVLRLNNEIERLKALMAAESQKMDASSAEVVKNQNNIKLAVDWLNKNIRPDITEINQKLTEASLHNQHFNSLGLLADQHREMFRLKGEVESIKGEITIQEDKRTQIIATSQLPIPNFTFDDEDMFLNGLPLEENQLNTATLIDVSIDIAIALNPGLKVIFIHEGNLFDKGHLEAVIKKIEDRNFMAIVELVSEDNEVECVFSEEVL